jgi:UDP-glucose 4-epimerase
MKILITAGAGFIGSSVILHVFAMNANADKAHALLGWKAARGLQEMCVDIWKYQVMFKSNCRK